MRSAPPLTTSRAQKAASLPSQQSPRTVLAANNVAPKIVDMTPEQRLADVQRRIKETTAAEQAKAATASAKQGKLGPDSIFAGEYLPQDLKSEEEEEEDKARQYKRERPMAHRSPSNMAAALDPNPTARTRWQRMMVIRNIRHKGRLTREMKIARSERSHMSKSSKFKTSVKKLMPLARQIAGKSIDDAILQMRFSKKKVAKEIQKHLIQARNEAVVMKGMGIARQPENVVDQQLVEASSEPGPAEKTAASAKDTRLLIQEALDMNAQKVVPAKTLDSTHPSAEVAITSVRSTPALTSSTPLQDRAQALLTSAADTPPSSLQRPQRTLKRGVAPDPTDIYIAEAWVNKGRYGKSPSPRARGRMDVLQHPHTGITVLLKEEKTRTRIAQEKHMRGVRKRLRGGVWESLPDRPLSRQSQYVLW